MQKGIIIGQRYDLVFVATDVGLSWSQAVCFLEQFTHSCDDWGGTRCGFC